MCLGVPGKIVAVDPDPLGMTMGKVSFGGITKQVCLAYTPEAEVGDYVVVHVGFAISRIDEAEAERVLSYLEELGEMEEFGAAPGAPSPPAPLPEGKGGGSKKRVDDGPEEGTA